MNALDFYINDILQLHNLKINSDENLFEYYKFLKYDKNRIMFVVDNKLYSDSVFRFILRDDKKIAKIQDKQSDVYHMEELENNLNIDYEGDFISFIFKSEIPSSRLNREFEEIQDLPTPYLEKLSDVYKIILPSIYFLINQQVITYEPTEKPITYTQTIREFLKNELKT